MLETALAIAVTIYGIAGALASILQLRCMWRRRSSADVSLAYLSIVGGGYFLWLAYGIALGNLPLVLVGAVGGGAIAATTSVAYRLRVRPERSRSSRSAPAESSTRLSRPAAVPRRQIPVTRFRTNGDYITSRARPARLRLR